jgi:hypothetical protein
MAYRYRPTSTSDTAQDDQKTVTSAADDQKRSRRAEFKPY